MTKNFTGEKTALLEAAASGHTASVIELLGDGTEIDAKDARGKTALMQAVKGEHLETVCARIERGADPNTKGNFPGFAPLVFAVKTANADILERLLKENNAAELPDLQFALGVAQLLNNERVL